MARRIFRISGEHGPHARALIDYDLKYKLAICAERMCRGARNEHMMVVAERELAMRNADLEQCEGTALRALEFVEEHGGVGHCKVMRAYYIDGLTNEEAGRACAYTSQGIKCIRARELTRLDEWDKKHGRI